MKGLIERFKNHMFNSDKIQKTENELQKENHFLNDILPNSEFGDIIWAQRFDFEWEKDGFWSPKHSIGPFIVIGKTEDRLICMYCTSVPQKDYFFEIGNGYNLFPKKTYTTINRIKAIDYESFVNINRSDDTCLSKEEKSLVAKLLHVQQLIEYSDLGLYKQIYFDLNKYIILSVGDIIRDKKTNQIKIIVKKDNDFIYTVPYNNNESEIKKEKEEDNEYIKSVAIEEIMNINNNSLFRVGDLLKKDNDYYYVYHTDGNIAKTFLLKKEKDSEENTIMIEKLKYIPYYLETIEIERDDNSYKVIGKASEIEKNIILNERRNFVEKSKRENRKKPIKYVGNSNHFKVGDIVEHRNYFAMEFIVIAIAYNKIITLSYDAYLRGKIIYREFDEKDYSLSKIDHIQNRSLIKEMNNLESIGNQVTEIKRLRLEKNKS